LAGLALAGLTAAAAWLVWNKMPSVIARLGYGDLVLLCRIVGVASVFAIASRLEHLLMRGDRPDIPETLEKNP
jgi:hypothetical protein